MVSANLQGVSLELLTQYELCPTKPLPYAAGIILNSNACAQIGPFKY
jgi:hypothetical protein